MSERHYFDLRYTIPGFAFVLTIIATNHVPLLRILELGQVSEVFGAFLAFLSLFSGSAIGFLVTQAWWWYWQNHFGILEVDTYNQAVDAFCKKYEIKKPECNSKKKREFITAIDYVMRSKIDESIKAILTAAERRWDMFHTLTSTYLALLSGLVIGLLSRFLPLFLAYFSIPYIESSPSELLFLLFLTGSVISLVYFMKKGAEWSRTFSASLIEALIRRSPIEQRDLEETFPRLYE